MSNMKQIGITFYDDTNVISGHLKLEKNNMKMSCMVLKLCCPLSNEVPILIIPFLHKSLLLWLVNSKNTNVLRVTLASLFVLPVTLVHKYLANHHSWQIFHKYLPNNDGWSRTHKLTLNGWHRIHTLYQLFLCEYQQTYSINVSCM